MEARPSNNNTRISCSASGQIQGQHAFEEGGLIIAGEKNKPYFNADGRLYMCIYIMVMICSQTSLVVKYCQISYFRYLKVTIICTNFSGFHDSLILHQ